MLVWKKPAGTVTVRVFEDTDGDGMQDPGEPGIEGVDVVITTSDGTTFTLTTDTMGMYMAEVPIGETTIDIDERTLPPGAEQTVGTDPTTGDVPPDGDTALAIPHGRVCRRRPNPAPLLEDHGRS